MITDDLQLDLEPLTPVVGAVARGVDLRRGLDDDRARSMRRAVLDHGVVFLRDQDLTRPQMLAFMERFGTPCEDPFTAAEVPVPPEETVTDMPTLAYKRATAVWHIDSTLAPEPASFIGLRAIELPPVGGDTCWGSMYAAYESLSRPLRDLLDGLSAVHSARKVMPRLGGASPELPDAMRTVHPVVRVHPETGRRALFVNELWTERIVELAEDESDHLLSFLYRHAQAPERTVRWRWRRHDVAVWDNRAFQHYAVDDYSATRVMQKSIIAGDRPVGPRGDGS